MSDIKKIADKVRNNIPKVKPARANRTLYLADPVFSRVRAYCIMQDINISDIIDDFLEQFAREIGEEALDHAQAQFSARQVGAAPRVRGSGAGGGD